METNVHQLAVVDPQAELDEGVEVGPFAVVGAGVRVGAGTKIESGAQLRGPLELGRDNHIFPGACLGFEPQDLKFGGENTRLVIGDRNHFRECSTFHRGTVQGGGLTSIGSDNLFMAYTHVAHDSHVGNHTIFANSGTLAGHVEVHDHATVGAFTSVHQFCRVGCYAYIGGYSVITRDALPYVKTVGTKPACYGLNRIGLERKGFSAEQLKGMERAYRILVRGKHSVPKALALLEDLPEQDEVRALIEFAQGSERGLIRDVPGSGSRGGRG